MSRLRPRPCHGCLEIVLGPEPAAQPQLRALLTVEEAGMQRRVGMDRHRVLATRG